MVATDGRQRGFTLELRVPWPERPERSWTEQEENHQKPIHCELLVELF